MLNEGNRETPLSKTPVVLNSSAHQKGTHGDMYVRNNHVTTVMLHGVSIVCLTIEGKERLCLAQISNTLLKSYSYNEIHNRRVALGITCVQCTPVQLEILRRAGAMPISSRRCGMITKREAERLVKSFLEDNSPPKLPDNFSFEVYHECGWGGRGKFEPSRYNSSRAKCIKCIYCNMYFSPNKFIFHFHKTPESKYNHPDAANFNSWRRHLKLVEYDADDIMHAWEDVKAMFNGGSRKRMLSSAIRDQSNNNINHTTNPVKKPRLSVNSSENSQPFQNSYSPFPFLSVPGKTYPISHFSHPPAFGLGMHFNKDTTDSKTTSCYPTGWGLPNLMPSYGMMWNHSIMNPSRLPMPGTNCYQLKMASNEEGHQGCEPSSSPESSPSFVDKNERFSAFRPVGRHLTTSPDSVKSEEKLTCQDENVEVNITDEQKETEKSNSVTKTDVHSPTRQTLEKSADILDKEKQEDKKEVTENHKYPLSVSNSSTHNDASTKEENTNSLTKDENEHEQALDLCCKSTVHQNTEDVVKLSKEQLHNQLKTEMNLRQKIEMEIMGIKDALSQELLQERHVRLTLHQKLKEAHEALSKFTSSIKADK